MSRILTGFLCMALASGAVLAQTRELSSSGVALDRVVAIVNEGIILQSQLDTQVLFITERLRGQGTELPPPDVIRQQVMERLILQEIQVQRATRLGVQVSDEMLNEALRDVAKRNNIDFEQMPIALEQQGVDYAAYRDEMRREIMLSLLRQRDVVPRIYVSPRELDQALERESGAAGENTREIACRVEPACRRISHRFRRLVTSRRACGSAHSPGLHSMASMIDCVALSYCVALS